MKEEGIALGKDWKVRDNQTKKPGMKGGKQGVSVLCDVPRH